MQRNIVTCLRKRTCPHIQVWRRWIGGCEPLEEITYCTWNYLWQQIQIIISKKIPVSAPTKISPMSAPYNHVKPCRAAPSMHRRSIALSRSPAVPSWTQPSHTHSISGITVALTKQRPKMDRLTVTYQFLFTNIHKSKFLGGPCLRHTQEVVWFSFSWADTADRVASSRTPG